MEWWKVSKFDRLALAISCFLPLFIIFGLENLCEAKSMFSPIENITWRLSLLNQSKGFYFNVGQFSIWLILLMVGIVGIVRFHRKFLKAKKLSKEVVVLVKAENITADYYFTYFSLFVISFLVLIRQFLKMSWFFLFWWCWLYGFIL